MDTHHITEMEILPKQDLEANQRHDISPPAYSLNDPWLGKDPWSGLIVQQRNRTGWPVGNITLDWPYALSRRRSTYWFRDAQGQWHPTNAGLEAIRNGERVKQFHADLHQGSTCDVLLEEFIGPVVRGDECRLHKGLRCFCEAYGCATKGGLKTIDFRGVILANLDQAASQELECSVHFTGSCWCYTFEEDGVLWVVDSKRSRIRKFGMVGPWVDIV
ncbi:uncharacterized protein LY89DRAFT_670886 [Mollisia scopiformis]|uniref:Uncharacterized protein n=1 Tax=Mollisia scopiformis TaxID=149040 RepID=A0A194X5F4_MOLSC|nr:uncharacterized protein LY89DRAFT_670886 [Mollisia scopiformis]KUJ15413.1 hypothetical protein LY89DRAFT_670886 [Mollisia scopiformis]